MYFASHIYPLWIHWDQLFQIFRHNTMGSVSYMPHWSASSSHQLLSSGLPCLGLCPCRDILSLPHPPPWCIHAVPVMDGWRSNHCNRFFIAKRNKWLQVMTSDFDQFFSSVFTVNILFLILDDTLRFQKNIVLKGWGGGGLMSQTRTHRQSCNDVSRHNHGHTLNILKLHDQNLAWGLVSSISFDMNAGEASH